MLKIGMSSAGKKINEQLFADYAKNGIGAIEISPGWPDYKNLDYKALGDYSRMKRFFSQSRMPSRRSLLISAESPLRSTSR